MKKFRVRILTEEYAINVFIGTKTELERAASAYLGHEIEFLGHRGRAYNCFPDKLPLILIDGSLPAHIAIATLAHETSHAMDDIAAYVSIHDDKGEFRAHGISAVMRNVCKTFLK